MAGSAEGEGFPSTFQLVWKLSRKAELRTGRIGKRLPSGFRGEMDPGEATMTAFGRARTRLNGESRFAAVRPLFGGSWLKAAAGKFRC